MNNSDATFLEPEKIWELADKFRISPELAGHEIPAIDTVFIADVILRLDIIEIPRLFADLNMDAALLHDLSGILVDQESIRQWDKGNSWVERRLRFSFAHEIGHLKLHSNLIADANFRDVGDFESWACEPQHYRKAEFQADEFAGRLLVPHDLLIAEYDRCVGAFQQADDSWRDIEGMREHVAKKIAPRFGVNHQVIETRFDRERIWPTE
jgi:hypothetical protein